MFPSPFSPSRGLKGLGSKVMRWDNVRAEADRIRPRGGRVPDVAKTAAAVAIEDAADLGWVRAEEGIVALTGQSLVFLSWNSDDTDPTSVTMQALSLDRLESVKLDFNVGRLTDHYWNNDPIRKPLGRARLVLDLAGAVPTVLNIDVDGTGDDDPAAALVSALLTYHRERENRG